MRWILAATTAGAGHFAGLLPFARASAQLGHDVRVAAPRSFAAAVRRAGFDHEELDDADPAAKGATFGRIPSLSTCPRRGGVQHCRADGRGALDHHATDP
ncbi:MAG: hypothetical protein WKF57_20700 [Nakamurella sp.]